MIHSTLYLPDSKKLYKLHPFLDNFKIANANFSCLTVRDKKLSLILRHPESLLSKLSKSHVRCHRQERHGVFVLSLMCLVSDLLRNKHENIIEEITMDVQRYDV